jgi:hypothetical protein
MTTTDPMVVLQTLPIGLDRFQALELARPERLEELTALLEDEDVAPVAARVLALLGSEAAVPALEAAARRAEAEVLEALVDCGPAGRAALRRLGADAAVGGQAILAMVTRFDRHAALPALLQGLAELGSGAARGRNQDISAMAVLLQGWLSGIRRVLDGEQFEAHLDQLAGLRLGPPSSPLLDLPLPCVARLRQRNHEAMSLLAESRQAATRLFREDLERHQPPDGASAGRNDPCPCGSGRKFKKCCLERQKEDRRTKVLAERCLEIDELIGFLEPPTRHADSARLLELLAARDVLGPWATAGESPLARWASAWSRLRLAPGDVALRQALAVLEDLPAPDVDTESLLLWLASTLHGVCPDRLQLLVPATARMSSGPGLGLLATMLSTRPEAELVALLEEVCAAGRGPDAIMSVLEAAMGMEEGPELAEEAIPFLRHAAAEDPSWQESLEAVLEWTSTKLWRPVATRLELPPEAAPQAWWLEVLEKIEEAPEEPSRLAGRLRLLATWPEGLEEVSEDSRAPLDEERRFRAELALRTLRELEEAVLREDSLTAELLAEKPGALLLMLGEEGLDWVLPEGGPLDQAMAVAAAAGTLAAELGLDHPSAIQLGARFALRQGGTRGHEAEVGVAARVILEETFASAGGSQPETFFRLVGERSPAEPAPFPEGADPVLVEKARRAGLHPLELAAESSARGRRLAARPPRPSPPEAAMVARAPEVARLPEPGQASQAPPVALADDPIPARKAVRRVLRRLLRTGKIGESHTSVDLVSRGVAGHLRGAVKDSVGLLLARGVLREKPTLVGLHTSVEPRHVAAVERFVEEGWLPDPGLAGTLGLNSARA